MGSFRASLIALKIGNGAPTEVFTAIGGSHQYHLHLSQQLLDASDMADGNAWRVLQNLAGPRMVRIQASGILTDSAGEQQLASAAFSGAAANYQCCFANGEILQGAFIVQEYQRSGEIEGEEAFRLVMESAGGLEWIV